VPGLRSSNVDYGLRLKTATEGLSSLWRKPIEATTITRYRFQAGQSLYTSFG
jgi:hypothetical protein